MSLEKSIWLSHYHAEVDAVPCSMRLRQEYIAISDTGTTVSIMESVLVCFEMVR